MTAPARLSADEGHFVEETWMAGLRPALAYFVSSLSLPSSNHPSLSFSCHVSPKLVRIQMFGRGCTKANENRITCPELENGEGAGENSLLRSEARRK
ncbi:unnamed protein product [Lasius platythorax]|uniref:Uncharacterized protein n=1 Tax=Lasius platythorax TaxID=488582 RepID=A0AAV2NC87_9HYME